MTQEPADQEWSLRLAQSIAGEVRRRRQELGLSAQQLSDRCSSLGMPIQRSVLANLESGRRTTVAVPEVLVLAAALEVPPGLLLFPVGKEQFSEILPGAFQEPHMALQWLSGRRQIEIGDDLRRESPIELQLVNEHESLMERLVNSARGRALAARAMADMVTEEELVQRLESSEQRLFRVIEEITSLEDPQASATEEVAQRLSRLRREKEELQRTLNTQAERLHAYRYARQRADRSEKTVERLERLLLAKREEMRKLGILPPLLDPTLEYLEPGLPTRGDMPVRRPLAPVASQEEFSQDELNNEEPLPVPRTTVVGDQPYDVDAIAERLADRVIENMVRRGLIKPPSD